MKKIILTFLLFVGALVSAQNNVPCPTCPPGGAGGDGFGSPASPIDMYLFLLLFAGVAILTLFAGKYRRQNA